MFIRSIKATFTGCVLLFASVPSLTVGQTVAADANPCDIHHDSGYSGALKHSITSSGKVRNFGMYIPEGYNDNLPTPRKLIIDFHGKSGTSEKQYENSQYYLHPMGKEYLVAYPLGIDRAWQSAPYAEGHNDLQFVADLLVYLRNNYCIDSNHIYASGKSNGGGFVDYLACSKNGDEFAAFAMSAPELYSDTSSSSCQGGNRPRNIIEAHGDADCTSCYDDPDCTSHRKPLPRIPKWLDWWGIDRNKCKVQGPTDSGEGYTTTNYISCMGGEEQTIEHYMVKNLRHCWPQIDTRPRNSDYEREDGDCGSFALDFTDKVINFFSSRSLRPVNVDGEDQHGEL